MGHQPRLTVGKSPAAVVPGTGQDGAVLQHVPHGVAGHHGPHHQVSLPKGAGPDAPLHGKLRAADFPNGAPGPRSKVPLLKGKLPQSRLTGRIAHGSIRANLHRPKFQIKENRGTDIGNHRHHDIPANAHLFQLLHHTSGSIQPKGAAASEDHSMDHLPVTDRVQSIGVPGSRRTAPDIHAGDPALGT